MMVPRVVCKLMERFSTGSPIAADIHQGCVVAPDLFNCITDYLMDAGCNSFPDVQLRDYKLTNLTQHSLLVGLEGAFHMFNEEATRLGLCAS